MAYALPNPKDYGQPWFHDGMLVPILVGMDFLSKVGLILDFSDGHAVHAKDPDPTPYHMLKNVKGHFMVNIAEYILGSAGSEVNSGLQEHFALEASRLGTEDRDEGWFELGPMEMCGMDVLQHEVSNHEQEHVQADDGNSFFSTC